MPSSDVCDLSIFDLSEQIKAGNLSPVDVTDAHLARIDDLNPKLNAFITVCHEEARAAAKVAEAEIAAGNSRGPLHGIPIGVKDIIDTEGVLTTQGSSFYPENFPPADAECIRRLKDAGAIIIGKCNTAEFAAESATKNPHHGACRNPWDVSRVPAGSSGGSGSALAACMVPGALGTDTGGSVRGPAAICGIVGLKPTYGRISVRGVYPNAVSLDHVGPMTRTVRDCALLLQGMAGYDPEDPFSVDMPVPDFCEGIEDGAKGLRLALCPDLIDVEIDRPIADALESAIEILRDLGAQIETVDCPFADEINLHRRPIADAEFLAVHRTRYAASPDGYGTALQQRLENAKKTTLDQYIEARIQRKALRRRMAAHFASCDAVILPGYPSLAAPIETTMATVNGKEMDFIGLGRNLTGPQNFVGFPGLSVPTGFDPEHELPMAMQVVGLPGEEAKCFRIGHAFEQATPEIHGRRPQL